MIFIFFFFHTYALYSQGNLLSNQLLYRNFLIQNLTGEKYLDPGKYNTNIYFVNNWLNGDIILSNGLNIDNLTLKFDCSKNQLIYLNEKFGTIQVDNECISDFYLDEINKKFHFRKMYLDTLESKKEIFVQFIYKNKMEISVYRKVVNIASIEKEDGIYKEFKARPVYILRIRNKTYFIYKPSHKAIFELFPYLKEPIKKRITSTSKIKSEDEFFRFLIEIEDLLYEKVL